MKDVVEYNQLVFFAPLFPFPFPLVSFLSPLPINHLDMYYHHYLVSSRNASRRSARYDPATASIRIRIRIRIIYDFRLGRALLEPALEKQRICPHGADGLRGDALERFALVGFAPGRGLEIGL